MNYKETTEYLFSQLPVFQQVGSVAYKPGLENALTLDRLFNYPHKAYRTIHVGGTNGKGSISHTLAAILQQSGYSVGLYTSPHLVDFRERIRVNGEKIEEKYVVEFVEKNRADFEPIRCSFFELTMMMSFCYFRDREVDVAIIEVGLGGRLDSTNIIDPDLCIISNIGIDHVQFLGNTRENIAMEKAGIIKYDTPVIIGEAQDEVKEVFLEQANNKNAPIIFADFERPIIKEEINNGKWLFSTQEYRDIVGELGGFAQIKNSNTILTAIKKMENIGYNITYDAIYEGFKNVSTLTGLMGRWQVLRDSPKVICDTAHNISGFEYIVEQIANERYNKLHIIIGVANDKDVNHMLELLPKEACYYFVKAQIDRALPADKLKELSKEYNLDGNDYIRIKEAYHKAFKKSNKDDLIFIGGSNFVVGEFLEFYYKENL